MRAVCSCGTTSRGVPRGTRGTLFCILGFFTAVGLSVRPAPADEAGRRLVAELREEGNWEACRRECLRLIYRGDESDSLKEMADQAATSAASGPTPSREGRQSLLTLPARWLISLYRTQISPAIGRRCSLHPSCSEYARQAMRKHGLLGLAMYADRGIREPRVVAERRHAIVVNGRVKYRDPLEEHDYWLE